MHTNKEKLFKGIKIMAGTLFLLVLAPIILNSSFKNQDHPFFIPILGIGIICFIAAIYFGFKGIKTLMRALYSMIKPGSISIYTFCLERAYKLSNTFPLRYRSGRVVAKSFYCHFHVEVIGAYNL